MKLRLLKKILNNTGYYLSNCDEYLAIGSGMVHNLISLDVKTLNITYALDTFREGRESIRDEELLFIWDKLHELVKTGQIREILDGRDEIENPLPVFTVEDGVLIESVTDAYGRPNIDDNGVMMYYNTHFPTKEQAIEKGLKDCESGKEFVLENVESLEKELAEARSRLREYEEKIENLKTLL